MPIHNDFRYTEKEDHIIIRAYCGDKEDVVVPESINGKPVHEISSFAFVPEKDIQHIEFKKHCVERVHSIVLPNTILRLDKSFIDCRELAEILIPRNAELINGDCFGSCFNLKAINADPNSILYTSNNGILYSKDGTRLLRCPPSYKFESSDFLNGVTEIRESAFAGCKNLTEICIPESVLIIESSAFSNCRNLRSIQLHKNIRLVGTGHFWCCKSLESIDYYNVENIIPAAEFYGCESLKSINIYTKPHIIGDNAFEQTSLISFIVPKGTTAISKHAFLHCNNLKTIEIPRSVSRIHRDAFIGCGKNYYSTEELNDVKTGFGYDPKTLFLVVRDSKADKFCQEKSYSVAYL